MHTSRVRNLLRFHKVRKSVTRPRRDASNMQGHRARLEVRPHTGPRPAAPRQSAERPRARRRSTHATRRAAMRFIRIHHRPYANSVRREGDLSIPTHASPPQSRSSTRASRRGLLACALVHTHAGARARVPPPRGEPFLVRTRRGLTD